MTINGTVIIDLPLLRDVKQRTHQHQIWVEKVHSGALLLQTYKEFWLNCNP